MATAALVWTIVCGVVALIWASRHVAIQRAKTGERVLSSRSYDGPPRPATRISVLVAAKDEDANIERCLRSMLTQDYPDFEVIAINDRSTDRTGEILDELAVSDPGGRLRVVHVKRLREGWFGKNNAMREGVSVASGAWYCFIDADCRQISKSTLSVATREAMTRNVDFLSVLPVLETHSFWERLLQPVCAAIMVIWFRPEKVNDPESKAAYANGAFMLMRRDCYERIGGHARVRAEVNEDMHMARLAKEVGLNLKVIQNADLYVTRMYSTLAETWRGWSRIFYGCFGSLPRLAATALMLLMVSILPWISLAAGIVGALVADPSVARAWTALALVGAGTILIKQSVLYRFYRLARSNPVWSIGYLPAAVICLGMVINAMLKRAAITRTVWRGTTYRGAHVDAADRPGESKEKAPHA